MPRASDDDVRAIIETDPNLSMVGFLEAASVLVGRAAECATKRGITISEKELRVMETWVAAHFYAARDPQYVSKSTGRASASFQRTSGTRLDSTDYGATAIMLDPSGCLETASKGAVVQTAWLGTEYT